MFNIKEVITVLCKYLSISIDTTIIPEHFRLAKYDKISDNVVSIVCKSISKHLKVNVFWTILDKLTHFALKEVNNIICLTDFDKCIRTKLRLAYLQYPSLEIYSLSETTNNSSSRALLIALVWLITKHDILRNIVQLKLLNSSLGREFSKVNINSNTKVDDARYSTVSNQVNNLLQKTNKLSSNLKAISELYVTKIKLMTKVHAASIATSGLPHLTVSEMSLIKKIATNKGNIELELERIKEMEKIALMLDTHMKWTKKSHIFYTWMSTVFDECEKTDTSIFTSEALTELARFIYLLRHIIKKRLKLAKNDNYHSASNLIEDCPSRHLRVQKCATEAHIFLNEIRNQFNAVDESLQKKRTDLEIELKSVLSFISNSVRV